MEIMIIVIIISHSSAILHYVYVMMDVKYPQPFLARVGHCVIVAGFYLFLNNLHLLKTDIDITNSLLYADMRVHTSI